MLAASMACGGCAGGGERGGGERDWRADGREVFGPAGTSGPSGAGGDGTAASGAAAERGSLGWGVFLQRFGGAGATREARLAAEEVKRALGRTDVFVRTTESGAAVVLGSFASFDAAAAQAALAEAKAFRTRSGVRPFASAILVPPPFEHVSEMPQFDLERAVASAQRPVAFSLQIEQYDAADRSERARVAEQRVLELRRAGEEAFYYHGLRFSVVTVGLFGRAEYDPLLERASPRIEELQERFPQMLLNGRPYTLRVGGRSKPVNSFLIHVPGAEPEVEGR